MPKSHFTPLAPVEAVHVVEAVLAIDPLGNDNCPYCAHPNRRQLDIDLLTTDSLGSIVDKHQLAVREDGDQFGKEYSHACAGVERHRRLHVLKTFESLDDADRGIPGRTAPTLHFVDWTVQQYIETYKECEKPQDQLSSLSGLVKALKTRAEIRGEIAKNGNKHPDTIETEVILSDADKRRMIMSEAKRMGLKLIEAKTTEVKE